MFPGSSASRGLRGEPGESRCAWGLKGTALGLPGKVQADAAPGEPAAPTWKVGRTAGCGAFSDAPWWGRGSPGETEAPAGMRSCVQCD